MVLSNRKGGLTWAAENESQWYTTPAAEGSHRFLLHAKIGFYFDSHHCGPELLSLEAPFFPSQEQCTCHLLATWWMGRSLLEVVRGVTRRQTVEPLDMYSVEFSLVFALPLDRTNLFGDRKVLNAHFETDLAGGRLFGAVLRAVTKDKVKINWLRSGAKFRPG